MERAQRRSDTGQHRRLEHRSSGGIAPRRTRHEPALGLDESDDLRADTECCGRLPSPRARRERSIPEQAGVLPADAEHEQLSADSTYRLWFVIPPPSTSNRRAATRPDALDLSGEDAHARIRSPFGSNSGSAATTPGTHSPKISTAISVPDIVLKREGTRTQWTFFTVYP